MDWTDKLTELKTLLESGKATELPAILETIKPKSVPRRHAAELANLARRAGEPHYALRVLAPYVSERATSTAKPSSKETAIYAGSLAVLGGTEEALEKLTALTLSEFPQAAIYLAHAYFATWDYASAIFSLETLRAREGLEADIRLIAEVNLVAALVYERHDERARVLLSELKIIAQARGRKSLLGNLHELTAQLEIAEKNWDAAEASIRAAEELLVGAARLERHFTKKWALVLELNRKGPSKDLAARWEKARLEAVDIGHYETLRDMDLRWGLLADEPALLWRVYFGTPWEKFRERIFKDSLKPIKPPGSYLWVLPPASSATPKAVLSTLELRKEGSTLPCRVLLALVADFYRPFTLVQLHRRLYPGEYYNPTSSPGRVHEAVAVAREWLRTRRSPLEIAQEKAGYFLKSAEPCAVEVSSGLVPVSREENRLDKLSLHFGTRPFDVREAAEQLDISVRSVNRVLSEAVADNRLEKIGAGKGTSYIFKKSA